LEGDQCDNETNLSQPVVSLGPNITIFFSGDLNQDSAMAAPQKNHPQVKREKTIKKEKANILGVYKI